MKPTHVTPPLAALLSRSSLPSSLRAPARGGLKKIIFFSAARRAREMSRTIGFLALVATVAALRVEPLLRIARPAVVARRVSNPTALLPSASAGVGLGGSDSVTAATLGAAAADSLAQVDLPSTVLVADVIEFFQAFADSPFILLIPIGAGAAVASIIIYILVKSAG